MPSRNLGANAAWTLGMGLYILLNLMYQVMHYQVPTTIFECVEKVVDVIVILNGRLLYVRACEVKLLNNFESGLSL